MNKLKAVKDNFPMPQQLTKDSSEEERLSEELLSIQRTLYWAASQDFDKVFIHDLSDAAADFLKSLGYSVSSEVCAGSYEIKFR